MKFVLAAFLLAAPVARAQIFADFTVSHGENPLGTFRVLLAHEEAPRTCANFIGLATGRRAWLDTRTGRVQSGTPYYDGLTFHRLIHNFMIQGGDPQGTGRGGPGYGFQDEFHPDLRHNGRYVLSMANSGVNTNGSQFFITLEAASTLDDKHSVFGEVINDATHPNGKAIIDGFTDATNFPTGPNDVPDSPIVMESVVISGPGLAGFDIDNPALLLPTVNEVKTKVRYDPDGDTYAITWDRKFQTEYLPALSFDLNSWVFTTSPYLLSLDAQTDYTYTINGITGDKFFSRVAGVDYSLTPNAPTDLVANGKVMTVTVETGETIALAFDGAGTGTWTASDGGSGTLGSVVWSDSAPDAGMFSGSQPQAKFIPLGNLKVTFDTPAGSEHWDSLNFDLSFHTATSGWCVGTARDTVPDSDPIIHNKRTPFTYTLAR